MAGSAPEATGGVIEGSEFTRSRGEHLSVITFRVETEQETDGRWFAEVVELPGVLAYGSRQEEAVSRVQALALRVAAERLEHGEAGPELLSISFKAA